MIQFFRKIRRVRLTENNVGKYLLYALGEIVLVVIGILIALQINTWNEWKKERIKERDVLIDLVENLEINIATLKDDIKNLQKLDKSSEIVINTIQTKQYFNDTLASHFHRARIPKRELLLSQTGYSGYKDIGLQILTNKEVKKEVLTLFETTYPKFLSDTRQVNGYYPEFDNHIVQNFIYADERLEPVDYVKLLTDHFYLSWIRAYKEGRKSLVSRELELLSKTCSVMRSLQTELIKMDPDYNN